MDIKEQRMIRLFNITDYFSFGSLWKVKNFLWQKVIPGFVIKERGEFHPALSLGRKNLTSLCQTVPMFLGSHSQKKGFPIRNFSSAKEKTAGFFKIRPYFFHAADAAGPQCGIERNEYKPRLAQNEISELKVFLQGKGIRFDE